VLNPLTHRKVLETGVPGRASVVAMGSPDRDAASSNLPMTLQVYVEGWSPYEVEDRWRVRSGDASGLSGWVPVRVDPDDLQNVAIDWDGVRAAPQPVDLPPEPAAEPVPPVPDALSRLERLGALRTSGVLTDSEFQAQKLRILGES
jgi:hypothetical protein